MHLSTRLLSLALALTLPASGLLAQQVEPNRHPVRPAATRGQPAQARGASQQAATQAERNRRATLAQLRTRGEVPSARIVDGGGRLTPKQVRERLERVRQYRQRQAQLDQRRAARGGPSGSGRDARGPIGGRDGNDRGRTPPSAGPGTRDPGQPPRDARGGGTQGPGRRAGTPGSPNQRRPSTPSGGGRDGDR